MNDSQFRMNPIVTLQHCYHMLRLKSHAPTSHEIAATPAPETPPAGPVIQMQFTSEEQVNDAIRRRLTGLDPHAIVQAAIDRAKGRI
jgi:hypothetical protein